MKHFKRSNISLIVVAMLAGNPGIHAAPAGADYLLGSDDVVSITVANHVDLNKDVAIRPDGKITLARVGDVNAAGKTTRDLAATIQRLLERTLNHADVTVALKEVHSRHASILGAIKNAGSYDLKNNARLMDLVAQAGGLSTKAVRVSGRVVRAGAVIPVDVERAVARPDSTENLSLKPNDMVVLDERDITKQIHVIGQVKTPGSYDLDEGLTPVSLMAQAGGAADGAALRNAYVLRNGEQLPLDLQAVLIEGKDDATVTGFKFQAGDVLVVPENQARYGIMGQVTKPAFYPLPANPQEATVLKALAGAGGRTPDGDLRHATLTRIVDGKSTVIPVDIEELLKGNTPDVPIQVNDVLYLPQINDQVSVMGKVNKPGAYKLTDNGTLISLLGEAGGQLESAALDKAYVIRGATEIPVNLQNAVGAAHDPAIDGFKVVAGDVLFIPENLVQYAVMGEVRLGGKFYFPESGHVTVIDALSSAGGQLPSANLNGAVIVRNTNGQAQVIPLNLGSMMKRGGTAVNVELQPKDVLYVPDKKPSNGLTSLLSLGSLARLFF